MFPSTLIVLRIDVEFNDNGPLIKPKLKPHVIIRKPALWAKPSKAASRKDREYKRISYDKIPRMNFSQITDDLFIGNTPSLSDYERLRELGVRLIINMRFTFGPKPDPHPFDMAQGRHQPISTLWLRSIDSPLFPLSIQKLMHGARAALETIRDGGRVYAHCAYGRHRGVAMGACILIAQGHDPQAAMKLIAERRSVADPFAYYIRPRILKFAREWNGGT